MSALIIRSVGSAFPLIPENAIYLGRVQWTTTRETQMENCYCLPKDKAEADVEFTAYQKKRETEHKKWSEIHSEMIWL